MNISLVCACKNRIKALRVSLASWLLFDEIKEIIIVDWSSDEPINYLTKLDPRIKVVRVSDQIYFNQPQPLNIAISMATGDYILKADTDYVLNPYHNFFNSYLVDDNSFVSGQHNFPSPEYVDPTTGLAMFDRSKMTLDELSEYFNSYSHYFKYLTGFLLVKRKNLLAVGGYNETLTKYYAFEDDEICKRLEVYGLEHKKINFDYNLIHLPHPDTKRFENFRGFNESTFKELITSLPDGEQKWQTEYYISQVHINNNKLMCQEIKDYYSHPLTKWNIQQLDNQNFFAEIIPNKKLDGIPSVYCVSLEESQNRRDNLECHLEHYGIKPTWIVSKRFDECNDTVTGKYADTLNGGTKGCVISHLRAIQNWYETKNEDYGFFCEDDLSLETVEYWDFIWEDFIEKVPEDAECVQLLTIRGDFDTFELRERYWDDWGATAYIVTRDYAKKLIDTYIREDSFHLEIPDFETMPLIENILFASVGKTYTYPLFVEEIKFQSTFVGKDDDVKDGQKKNHYVAHQKVLEYWRSKSNIQFQSPLMKKKSVSNLVDCFTYFNNKELLQLRVNLLKDYVDKFVIVEANYTQSGNPKDYTLKKTIKELNLPKDIIEIIEVDLSVESLGPPTEYEKIHDPHIEHASRERVQRDLIAKCLETNNFNDDTIFMVSDIDEMINPEHLHMMCDLVRSNRDKIFKVDLVYLEGRADLRCYHRDSDQPKDWSGALCFCLKEHMEKVGLTHIRSNTFVPYQIVWPYTQPRTENGVFIPGERMRDMGWHFTWMGTNEDRLIKSQNLCHSNIDIEGLLYKNFSKETEKWREFFLNYKMGNENVCPSGLTNFIMRKYPIENLPSIIFDLPLVKEYLLSGISEQREKTELENLITIYSLDTENPENNFNLGVWYESNGHTAPALSYFLRCAERAEDKDLAYESLIRSSYCYDKQGTRDGSAKSLLEQALCLCPNRPEAYYLLSRFAERRQWWQDCYIYADQGLMYADLDSKPLKTNVEYPGKYGFLFEKSIAAWWWGKVDEARSLIMEVKNNYQLSENHIQVLNNNLKVMGIE